MTPERARYAEGSTWEIAQGVCPEGCPLGKQAHRLRVAGLTILAQVNAVALHPAPELATGIAVT